MATLTTSYQLIASKYIGAANTSTNKNIYLRIYAKYTSQSIADNKSYVSYKSTLYVEGSGTYFYTGSTTTKSLSGTGATSTSGDAQGNYYLGETTLCEISGSVAHSSTGAASVSVTAGWVATPWGINGSLTGTATLPTIARATTPTLSPTGVTMGSSMTITLTPADNSFKHKLRYSFGSLSSQVAGLSEGNDFTPAGKRTITFTPPTSLGSQIPSATSGTCTMYCYTYTSSGTHIGTTSKTITLSVPNYTPTASVAITGNNLLGGMYVNGKSTVTAKITAPTTNLYGATIKSYSSTVGGKTYSGSTFTSSVLATGNGQYVSSTVTDSRGKSITVKSATFAVYAYSVPYITTLSAVRQSDGTTVVVTLKGGVSSVNGQNGKAFSVTLNGVTNTISSDDYTVDGTTTFTNVSTDSTFEVVAKISDHYTSATKTAILPTVAVTMDFHHSGKGVAFGKVSEEEGLLDVAWPMKSPSVDNLLGGYGTAITSGSDLNSTSYVSVGTYVCNTNAVAAGLKNCPTSNAFKMTVTNVIYKNPNPNTGANWYLVREIMDLYGHKYYQYVHCYAETGWSYSAWFSKLDSFLVKDYVIEQGTDSDGWEYTKWNNGRIELYSFKSLSFPATTKIDTYVWRTSVSIDMSSKLKEIRGGSCPVQYEGVVPQLCRHSTTTTLAEIMIVTSRTLAAFTKTIPIYIIGKWK